ncbi:MAG: formate/nitrite transporter family protein [Lachnospiraceae bacterium]|nr:formate/nitrite transporter family protein [Lachnospiraceae bacterium]
MKPIVKSIYGGLSIAMGCLVYLQSSNKFVGAFLFTVGLFSVVVFELNLFTGKVCYKEEYKPATIMVWIGNLIGTVVSATIIRFRFGITETASAMLEAKLAKSVPELIIDGIVCGICIGIAVKGYRKAEGFGKYLALVLGVMVFIIAGGEHVVADMFYLTAAGCDIVQMIKILAAVTVGNIIGGAITVPFNDKQKEV